MATGKNHVNTQIRDAALMQGRTQSKMSTRLTPCSSNDNAASATLL